MRRAILILTCALLCGCDVATAALLVGGNKKSSSDDAPLVSVTPPDPGFGLPIFKAWVAMIPDGDAESTALIAANGEPSASVWTEMGPIPANEIFDPAAVATDINAILIQASSTQNYELDAIEILDATNQVIAHASAPTWSYQVTNPVAIEGAPDGSTALTTAVDASRAFIFSLYSVPIDRFRVHEHAESQPPQPGDVLGISRNQSLLNERPGGMAIDANGLVHLTITEGDTVQLLRFDLNNLQALPQDTVEVSSDFGPAGSHSVALNSSGVIFTAASVGSGTILVRRFESNLTAGNTAGFASSFNNDRVEHNSITVDSLGNIVVVGGLSSLLSGRNHWRVKLPDTVSGGAIWQDSASQDSSSTSYWHAVAPGASGDVFMTGDLRTALLGGTDQITTAGFNAAGVGQWSDEYDGTDSAADLGHAIELDGAGNVYVGGYFGSDAGEGRNAAIIRYTPGGASSDSTVINGPASGNDEILDLAIDPADGSIYAVGYETVTGQGENIWVRKLAYNMLVSEFVTVWSRTHHGGTGNDRAVSCALYGNSLVVAGYETQASGQTKLVLRVYEK